ncbi:hypothetical protein TWF696_005340 [Orbilia brochopaga]|uniref:Uncharacterized protein n=1 Tax=Orbilia brochopaga TaxID=3140254 RepID=A0AAV9V383_9PEZI
MTDCDHGDLDELFDDTLLDEPEETDMDHLFDDAFLGESFLDEPLQAQANAKAQHSLTFPTPPASGVGSVLTFPTRSSQPPSQGGSLTFPTPAAHPLQPTIHHPLHLPAPPSSGHYIGSTPQLSFPSPPLSSAAQRPVIRNDPFLSAQSPSADGASPDSAASPNGQGTKRKNKPRVNWTDEESMRLLKGVEAYGIGSWAKIRADPRFNLEHRKGVDLKDRFRTIFPNEYRLHAQRTKSTKVVNGVAQSPSPDPPTYTYTDGTSADNPVILELDYEAAKLQKRRNRKRAERRNDGRIRITPPPRPDPEDPDLTTATGRRRVLRKNDVPWTPEEDADLVRAFNKYRRRFRLSAGDQRFAFYGRTILDIRNRFVGLYPELVPSLTAEELMENPLTTFEQGLINDFGTTGASQREVRKKKAASGPKRSENKSKASKRSAATCSTTAIQTEDPNFVIDGDYDAPEAADNNLPGQASTEEVLEIVSRSPELSRSASLGSPAPHHDAPLGIGRPALSLDVHSVPQYRTDGPQYASATSGTPALLNDSVNYLTASPTPVLPTPIETPYTLSGSRDASPTLLGPSTPGVPVGGCVDMGRPFDLPCAMVPPQGSPSPSTNYVSANPVDAIGNQLLGSPAAA